MHDPAAGFARARADIDDPVGGLHRLLVVLDDDERVAQVAQALKGGDELAVVALVQADRRLVEHVQDADEARTDLRGQADTLRLAARKGSGTARQRQVGEADIDEEGQACLDLCEDGRGDRAGSLLELNSREEFASLQDGQVGELGN